MDLNQLINKSWISIVFWGVILTVILLIMPDMGKLVREKGLPEIAAKYPYAVAQSLLNKMDNIPANDKASDITLVYYNKEKLTQENFEAIREKINNLESHKEKYGVRKILNRFTNRDLQDQVTAKDGTTLLVPLSIEWQGRTIKEIRQELSMQMKVNGVEFYPTGSDFIVEDLINTVEEGVKKTEVITIILIILILILVFRSPVAPLFTLMLVGLSFLISRGIVLQLVDHLNFTISNFTNIFLILVLFGIGTDYTMLLLMRFKEELFKGSDKNKAIADTFKTAGKTVFLSSLTILISSSSLMLAQFKPNRSAAAVTVGVGVLLLLIFSFLPAMMKLFGKHIFWSPLRISGHTDSPLWEKTAALSTKRPYFALLFVLMVCGLMVFYNGNLSYNHLEEVGKDYPSVKGFNIVSEHFTIGKALPVTIVIQNKGRMDNPFKLSELDGLTETLKSVKGIEGVYSVTQPKGERIKELYINDQTATVRDGLKKATDGIDKLSGGFGSALQEIRSKELDFSPVEKLQKGTQEMTSGIELVHKSVDLLKNGMNSGAQASKDLTRGIDLIDRSMTQLKDSFPELKNGYSSLGQGYQTIGAGVGQLLEQTKRFQAAFPEVIDMENELRSRHPELALDDTFSKLEFYSKYFNSKLQDLVDGISKLNDALTTANSSMKKANQGLAEAENGIAVMKDGTSKLNQGSSEMSRLLAQGAAGQEKISDALVQLAEGSKQLADGQNQLIESLKKISADSGKLVNGLSEAKQGLADLSSGLHDAQAYLGKLAGSKTATSFFIPEDEINGKAFSKSMNLYMSDDRKITKINLTLADDPYSEKAMEVVRELHQIFTAKIKESSLKDSEWGIFGVAQMNVDLNAMSGNDFRVTSAIMLAGILIVLLIVTRDFWMSVAIMLSLIASYYIAFSTSGLIFGKVLGYGNLTWDVPFFSFLMIIALGVDYSIFLIMRQRENRDMPSTQSIILAAKNVGGVIFSAAIILSGTFAAMYPSGIMTLMQLSITVILGIMLLNLVFLPVFLPAMFALKTKFLKT